MLLCSAAMMMDGVVEEKEDHNLDEDEDDLYTLTAPQEEQILQQCYRTAAPYADTVAFHKLMWDDQLTDSDKSRWLSQGINVREEEDDDDDDAATMDTTTTSATANDAADGGAPLPLSDTTHTATTMLEVLAQSHTPWGLVQHHGGPCGVLAAAQAELLRLLLFSNTTTANNHRSIPTTPHRLAPAPAKLAVLPALAQALALLLARVALTPCAVPEESGADNSTTTSTHVRIVLPTNYHQSTALTWQDLAPWYSETPVVSTALTIYSIPVSSITTNIEANRDNHNSSEKFDQAADNPKRQKMNQQQQEETAAATSSSSLTSRIHQLARLVEAFLLHKIPGVGEQAESASASPLDCFRRQGGVLLLVMSLAASRTIPVLQKEFDDPVGTRLTAQFGHCAQELINLLLTGQAVSNVFDNTLSPSGDMVCRGVQHRPAIGYLTQLEAMRYCEVGGYYKSPVFPIWVVGSTSHFTVLFGDASALKESQSDRLLDECRRAFKAVEGGDENGFIPTDKLETVLRALNIDVGGAEAEQSAKIQTLGASLEVSGASIILWDDFWKAASRLSTGASLETVLQGGDGTASSNPIILDDADEPPPLLTNFAENDRAVKPAARPAHVETDEEMARRLGAEWGSYTGGEGGMNALSTVASAATPMEVDPPPAAAAAAAVTTTTSAADAMTDEEIARKLQEQFDAEGSTSRAGSSSVSSVAAIRGFSPVQQWVDSGASFKSTDMLNTVEEQEDSKPAAKPTLGNMAFEQFGDSFLLHHYNGLRGGVLTQFRITRLTAEEAVGTSIALNRGATGGGSSHSGSGSQDLEDVVRTKWPACSVDWLGKQPPYID